MAVNRTNDGTDGSASRRPSQVPLSTSSNANKISTAAGGSHPMMSQRDAADSDKLAYPPDADAFARTVGTMAVAHVANGVGFKSIQRSAADTLVDVLSKYIRQIGSTSKEIAEHSGRTQCAATDIMQALQDNVPSPVNPIDLAQALQTAKTPFPRAIPSKFVSTKRASSTNMEVSQLGKRAERPANVPSFMPALPPKHTYDLKGKTVVEREQDPKKVRRHLLQEKSAVQQSLHSLHKFGGLSSGSTSYTTIPAHEKTEVFNAKRTFAGVKGDDANKKSQPLDTNTLALPKNDSQDMGKEDKILAGTFHDGDSE